MRPRIVAGLICAAAGPAAAQDFRLGLPIDCRLGQDCYIQQYVDHDPTAGAKDPFCGPLSYDRHKGTDFAVPTLRDLEPGVDVIASADGRVIGLRDGMKDALFDPEDANEIAGRECGNGVVLDHGDGWQTQYCHLEKGSVQVSKNQIVQAGAVLGRVGLSGRTQFPHVHLSVRKDGAVVDPFAPNGVHSCETPPSETLWTTEPLVQMGGVLDVGFADQLPEYMDVKAGTAAAAFVSKSAPALVAFGFVFGGRAGDVMRIEIEGPNGSFAQQDILLERTQAQLFRAIGKRSRGRDWAVGSYHTTVSLTRAGEVIDEMSGSVNVK